MTSVLSTHDLCKVYRDAGDDIMVLDKVNFNVNAGETVAIVGSSGVGKTTLLQLLGGLDQPTSGEVKLVGQSFSHLNGKQKGDMRNQHMGFVYQFHHLMPEFNALENVCIPLLIRGAAPKAAREKAEQYIEHVGLANRLKHRVGELSGGERQRIAIARALVTEPKCVLADEPTGNLDEATAEHVTDLLLSLNQSLRTSFVIVTHNKALAKRMSRTLTIINANLHEEN